MSGKPLPPPLVRPKSPPVDPSAGRTPPVPVRGWFPMFMVGDEARVAHAVPLKTSPALCGDSGLEFLSGHQLDQESAREVHADMMGRLLVIVFRDQRVEFLQDVVVRAVTGILATTAYAASNSPAEAHELVNSTAAEAREAIDAMHETEKVGKPGPH
jgi:hypothetical protein